MVLTKAELLNHLNKEVDILLHLIGKIDSTTRDYRPTPTQRSVTELLQYLSIMGPGLIEAAQRGGFDPAAWSAKEKEAAARDFDATVATIAAQKAAYAALVGAMSEADFRVEMDAFGSKASKGSFIVNLVLGGHAAYRTQLFCYLKACGRNELSTMNLWAGIDAPAAAV